MILYFMFIEWVWISVGFLFNGSHVKINGKSFIFIVLWFAWFLLLRVYDLMFHVYYSKFQVSVVSCLMVRTWRIIVSVSYLLQYDLHAWFLWLQVYGLMFHVYWSKFEVSIISYLMICMSRIMVSISYLL